MEKSSVEVSLVEKVCQLQSQVCEYERFLADLLLMLVEKDADRNAVQHDVPSQGLTDGVWATAKKLLQARNLKGNEETK